MAARTTLAPCFSVRRFAVERSLEYRPDLTVDLEPYTVIVVEFAAA